MNRFHTLAILTLAAFLLMPGALADGHEDEGGPSDAAIFGLCTAYGASETGRDASRGAGGEGEGEGGEGGADASPAFVFLDQRAEAQNQTTEDYCASQQRPGAPDGLPGAPDDVPGAPENTPGAPDDVPTGPGDAPDAPDDTPGAPDDTPGAPDDTPTGPGDGRPPRG